MNKEVTVTEKNKEVVTMPMGHNEGEELLVSDLIIPKLLLQQGLSDLVNERKAQSGDIVRSTTAEKFGSPDERVKVIPLTFRSMWKLQECLPGKKAEFRGMEPRNAGNETLPWEFKKDGADWQRIKVIEMFALLPKDIESEIIERDKVAAGDMPDLNKTLLPVSISFSSTSFKAGRAIMTHFVKAKSYKVKPYMYELNLGCYADKNDKGSYFVWDVGAETALVSPKYVGIVAEWVDMLGGLLASGRARVHEEVDDSDPAIMPGSQF